MISNSLKSEEQKTWNKERKIEKKMFVFFLNNWINAVLYKYAFKMCVNNANLLMMLVVSWELVQF